MKAAAAVLIEILLDEALGTTGADDFEFDAGVPNLGDRTIEIGRRIGAEAVEELEAKQLFELFGLGLPCGRSHADVIDTLHREQEGLRRLRCGPYAT